MGKKKKKRTQEILYWCYYCDRVFKDEGTLIQHQKAKHFRCLACTKKLNTAQGLQVHCEQVHKINVERVPAAKPGRDSIDREIFGMAGVPEGMKPGGAFDEPPPKRAAVDTADGTPPPPPSQPPIPGENAAVPRPPPMMPAYPGAPPMPVPIYMPQSHPAPAVGIQPGPQPPAVSNVYAAPPYGGMGYNYGAQPQAGRVGVPAPPQPGGIPGMPPLIAGMPPPVPAGGFPAQPAVIPTTRATAPPRGPPVVIQAPPAQAPGVATAVTPSSSVPRGGALFPIGTAPSTSNPVPPIPGSSGTDTGVAAVPAGGGGGDLDLVWKDEEFSMEEQRAKLPKYAAHLQNGGQVSEAMQQRGLEAYR